MTSSISNSNMDPAPHNPSMLLVIPPLSPSDTNPPLGPAILRARLARSGFALDVADLSIKFLNQYAGDVSPMANALGDQDKNRVRTHAAREAFIAQCPLGKSRSYQVPCCGNPVLGAHFDFETLWSATEEAASPGHPWQVFLDRHLFLPRPSPDVLGLSVMGPAQLVFALVVANLASRYWPDTLVIAGGSHTMLLRGAIGVDSRYGRWIDGFLPGHSENELVELLASIRNGMEDDYSSLLRAGKPRPPRCSPAVVVPSIDGKEPHPFELLPLFSAEDLLEYDASRLTLPMQVTRGCSFGRCKECTYPATEGRFGPSDPDWSAVAAAAGCLTSANKTKRVSFKDSFFTPKMFRGLADGLGDSSLDLRWSATTMLNDRLTPGLLADMFASGCRILEFGLESIWPDGQRFLGKPLEMEMVERVINGVAESGIVSVINLIYGLLGETRTQADAQLEWFLKMQARYSGLILGSHNMLEINRMSPFAANPGSSGLVLGECAQWAFSYPWNAPKWRPEFQERLRAITAELNPILHRRAA